MLHDEVVVCQVVVMWWLVLGAVGLAWFEHLKPRHRESPIATIVAGILSGPILLGVAAVMELRRRVIRRRRS